MAAEFAILAPNWLGDAVMALPAMADVRRASPGASIAVAARPAVLPLFGLVRDVDEAIPIGDLSRRKFDVAILLPNSFHAAFVAYRSGIPERWGYRTDWRAPLLTRAVPAPRGLHQVDYYRRLTTALGFEAGELAPHLDLAPDARAAGAALLAALGWNGRTPLVALAPGAAYGAAKRWPPSYFAELADALARDGVVSVMVGSSADAATGREVEAASKAPGAILNAIGRTDLPTLAGVLVHARTLVTNDSGAMHIAAALDVPVTAIFGPTREAETAPRLRPPEIDRGFGAAANSRLRPPEIDRGFGAAADGHQILVHPVWCRPCMLRTCPLDHACMRGVAPRAVLEAARRTL
jgi:heptosyltransferase II